MMPWRLAGLCVALQAATVGAAQRAASAAAVQPQDAPAPPRAPSFTSMARRARRRQRHLARPSSAARAPPAPGGAASLLALSWQSQQPAAPGAAHGGGLRRAGVALGTVAAGVGAWLFARRGAGKADAVVAPVGPSAAGWLVALLCAVSAVEGADLALLPASMFALQRDLGLRPGQLATMALWQALFEAAAAPVWGVLADRAVLTRRSILVLGCAGWGLVTAALALVDAYAPMVALRAVNGVLLASLRPICNGLVPDVVEENRRGRVYGLIALSTNVGGMAGGMVVTPISTSTIVGMQGWRIAFVVVGGLCVALSFVVAATLQEPPRGGVLAAEAKAEEVTQRASVAEAAREELQRLAGYFRIPTFSFIVAQGLFGMIPWNALCYVTLFLQTAGLGSYEAAFVVALGKATQSVGCLLGGILGDFAAERSPDHGRACVAQASVLAGIPMIWLLFAGAPPGEAAFAWYCTTYGALGLVATWCAAGVNWPIFTEIVPAQGRSAIVAWDTALEGISGAVFGNLAVTYLAEHCFGYVLPPAGTAATTLSDPANATALGQALAWSTTVPFMICLTIYSAMHWSYPRDVRRCREAAASSSG